MATLKYKIKRKKELGEVRFEAVPNEWATSAEATVVFANRYSGDKKEVPRIEHISWSAGARTWTIEDARKFFAAALKMLDAAEAELKKRTASK